MKTQAKRVLKPAIIKKNWARQRSDVTLSKELAGALVQTIMEGKPLFHKGGELRTVITEGDEEKLLIIPNNTLHSWVKRNNVIPETGETLRDILDRARTNYRTKQRERRQNEMVEEYEKRLLRLSKISTKVPIVGARGLVKDENGNVVKKENAELLRVQLEAAKFTLSRLDPATYGKIEKTENKHLVFSLSELRKAKAERDAQAGIRK